MEANKIQVKMCIRDRLLHAYKIRFVKSFGILAYLQDKEIVCPVPKLFEKIENRLI